MTARNKKDLRSASTGLKIIEHNETRIPVDSIKQSIQLKEIKCYVTLIALKAGHDVSYM